MTTPEQDRSGPNQRDLLSDRVVLVTRLLPDECVARLGARVTRRGRGSPRPPFDRHTVRGTVTSAGFAVKRSGQSLSLYATEAVGTFGPDAGGTRIRVQLGQSSWLLPLELAVIAAWLVLAGVPLLLAVRANADPSTASAVRLAVVPGLLVLLHAWGRWLARSDGPALVRFLCETLEAEVTTRDAGGTEVATATESQTT